MSAVRPLAFSDRLPPCGGGVSRVLPVSVHGVFHACSGSPDSRGVHERLAMGVAHNVAFPLSEQGRHAEEMISELNGWPACAPVNASPAMLPPPALDSGLERFATPFLCGSFILLLLAGFDPAAFSSPLFVPLTPFGPWNLSPVVDHELCRMAILGGVFEMHCNAEHFGLIA